MSGRNWTRKSIEELVEAYLRGKVRPATSGDESFCVFSADFCNISSNGPDNNNSIPVGYLNATPESLSGGHSYYPVLAGAPADYIEGAYNTYGQTRASQYSGSKSLNSGGFVSGKIVKPGEKAKSFTILTVPKTCDISALKALIVRTGAGKLPLYGHMALVTSDYANRTCDAINRTMYIASMDGTKPGYISSDQTCWASSSYGAAVYVPTSGSTYSIRSYSGSARFTKTNQDIRYSSYPMFHNLSNDGITYLSSFLSGIQSSTILETFFNYVKSHYNGTFVSGSDTRNLNFLTFIILSGSGSDDAAAVERQLYYLSRLFVDNVFESIWFYDADDGNDQPRFISENPTFGTPMAMDIYGSILTGSMVQYNKEYVTLT